jgi:hypothetical protein
MKIMLKTAMAFKVKFIAKVTSMGESRYMVIFPREYNKDGKHLRGKYVKAILEEITMENEDSDDHKKDLQKKLK